MLSVTAGSMAEHGLVAVLQDRRADPALVAGETSKLPSSAASLRLRRNPWKQI